MLIIAMLISMATTALAANNDGSITITNATIGKDYAVYKVFDLTYSNNNNVAYTYDGNNTNFLAALQGDASPFTLTGTGPYNVALKDGKGASDVSAFLTVQKEAGNLTQTGETKTATASTVKFAGLDYGYYYITSSLDTVVTIDSTMKDVTVVDKNQGPSWDNEDPDNPDPDYPDNPGKVIIESGGTKVIENSVNYGDTVNFSIAVNATAYNGTKLVTYYHITDTLGTGFSEAKDIVVKVGDATLTKDVDYTLTQDGNTFDITIPFGEKFGSNAKIEVTYSADVLNTAVLAGNGNPNTANFTWTEDEFDPNDPPFDPENPDGPDYPKPDDPTYPSENERKTYTYVYALGILKVDPEGKKLPGAEFTVKGPNGNTIYAYATGSDTGVYEYCASDATGAVSQFATDANGVLVIKGVAAGEYEVTEAVAPLGYNLLLNPVTVEAKMKEAYTTKITTYTDANGQVTNEVTSTTQTTDAGCNVAGLVVVNNAGTELPSTGGIGTTIFYMLGGILLVGAGVLLFVRRRAGYEK